MSSKTKKSPVFSTKVILAFVAIIAVAFGIPYVLDSFAFSGSLVAASDVIEAPKSFGLSTKGWVNVALAVAGILLILILVYLFDISKYANRLSGKEDNMAFKVNAWLLLIFLIVGMGAAAWEFYYHGPTYLSVASEHGEVERSMFMITLILTMAVFVVTQILLFVFSFIYRFNKNRKAFYYAHNNKLELLWTSVPAVVLTILVLRGFSAFSDFTDKAAAGTEEIEVFGYQFGWSARYAGDDKKLGDYSFNYISGSNPLGLAVKSEVEKLKAKLQEEIEGMKKDLSLLDTTTLDGLRDELSRLDSDVHPDEFERTQRAINEILSGEAADELEASIKRKTKQLERIAAQNEDYSSEVNDDMVVSEIHLVKDSSVTFKFRARDVIHSAYMPVHRMQMNVVPGMPTEFTFKPTVSTKEYKAEEGEDKDFYLYCNKICGSTHFNMKIKVVVDETSAERDAWLAQQKKVNMPEVKKVEEVQEETQEANTEEEQDEKA